MPQGVTYHSSIGLIPDTASGGVAPPSVPRDRTLAPFICSGVGVPGFVAPKGSLYINTTGSSGATRMYVNTDGGTTWTSVTTAA